MAALPGWGLSDLARGSISGAGARIGEKESLNRSGDSPSGSGALGETYGSAAPADENTSAGSGSGRSPRWSAPEPEPVSLRSSTRLSLFRAATVRLFKTTEAAVIGTRERAATAFTPIEEEGVFAMERRSSLGFEGLPEMPKGQGLQDEASVEWDTEARRWEVKKEKNKNTYVYVTRPILFSSSYCCTTQYYIKYYYHPIIRQQYLGRAYTTRMLSRLGFRRKGPFALLQ